MMTKHQWMTRAALMALFAASALLAACNRTSTETDMTTPTSLQITDVSVGNGAEARPGTTVSVHYTGWVYDAAAPDKKGKKFDSSKDHNQPFDFPLGAGQVIEGWDRGVAGMKVGGSRVLTIPPVLGYGARGVEGAFPPNATLIFDVELLAVR